MPDSIHENPVNSDNDPFISDIAHRLGAPLAALDGGQMRK